MSTHTFSLPNELKKEDGQPRRVGVEIEMSEIPLPRIAELVQANFGGTIRRISHYELEVKDTPWGTFKIELDFELLQRYGREKLGQPLGEIEQLANDTILALAQNLVPSELVTPPIPVTSLWELEKLTDKLREAGAKGTFDGWMTAFGVHLNPELPDTSAKTITQYLKAFECLYDWLKDREEVALTRQLSPFIKSFPDDYANLILQPDYWPDLDQLIDDYLEHNPSRNRALDMLPIFGYLDKERVMQGIGDQKLRVRPTLHYRLPNSDIDNPLWSLSLCWNDWCQVEALANNPRRLRNFSEEYLNHHKPFNLNIITPWHEKVSKWLTDLSSA